LADQLMEPVVQELSEFARSLLKFTAAQYSDNRGTNGGGKWIATEC
jgi:hypothetical protein